MVGEGRTVVAEGKAWVGCVVGVFPASMGGFVARGVAWAVGVGVLRLRATAGGN